MFTNMPSPSMNLFDIFLDDLSPPRGTAEIANGANDSFPVVGSQPDFTQQDDQITTRTASRQKARKTDDNPPYRAPAWLSQYLVEEGERCISHNIPPPEETFAEHINRQGAASSRGKTCQHFHTGPCLDSQSIRDCYFARTSHLLSGQR